MFSGLSYNDLAPTEPFFNSLLGPVPVGFFASGLPVLQNGDRAIERLLCGLSDFQERSEQSSRTRKQVSPKSHAAVTQAARLFDDSFVINSAELTRGDRS